jgi:HAD superfamily hydrolase (TIGR01662 family)
VGKGLIDEVQLRKIHDAIDETLIRIGGSKIQFFVCGHLESDKCICRKPSSGMLEDIIAEYSAKLQETIFIGDSEADEVAARNTGIDFLHVEELLSELNRKQV